MGAGSPLVATSMLAESMVVELEPDVVHVWVVDVAHPRLGLGRAGSTRAGSPLGPDFGLEAESVLAATSPAEQERAMRFRRPGDGDRFLAAHAALRRILAAYLQRDPRTLQFERGVWGKPMLADSELDFNLSHSAVRAVIAVARGRQVGVDVECQRPISDLEGLIARICTPEERATLEAMPLTEREGAFLALWTRKEALAKMTGAGLRAIEPDAALDVAATTDHRLEQLLDIPGYAACVAATGTDWRLVRRS